MHFACKFIISLIFLTSVCSCNEHTDTSSEMLSDASIIAQTCPDSAISILKDIDFDRLGTDEAFAYYLKGKAELDMLNFPKAATSLLQAARLFDESGNDSLKVMSYRGLMALSDSICDIDGKARYALKACEIYLKHNDCDNLYAVLAEFASYPNTYYITHSHAVNLKHYASILAEVDTVRAYFYADTTERRAEHLYMQLESLDSLYMSYGRSVYALNSFEPRQLIERIIHNDGWQQVIDCDSSDIPAPNAHLIAKTLWEQGLDKEARDFMNYYRFHYSNKIINNTIDQDSRKLISYISFRLNDTLKEEFKTTFQNDVKDAVTQFHYEEVLMREQTIHFQRIMIIMFAALVITIIAAAVIYAHMSRQRHRQQEELYMLSALELRNSLRNLEEQQIDILNHLCDTYYENHSNESIKSKASRDALSAIKGMASSDEFRLRLEKHLDDTTDGIMTKLQSEMPNIKESDYRLFLYNALDLTIPSICLMLGERREVIYNRRLRLRAKIQEAGPTHKDLFLQHLR